MQKEGVVALSPLRYNFITNSARLAEISLDSSEEGPSLLSQITIGTNAFIILSVILLLLLLFSAFFSSSETSFSTVNIIRLKNYVEEKKRGAKKALWIAEHFDRTLTTCLVGNNFVNIGATTVGAFLVSQLIINPTIANIVTTFAMTIIVLILGKSFPKVMPRNIRKNWLCFFRDLCIFNQNLLSVCCGFPLAEKSPCERKRNASDGYRIGTGNHH